VAFEGTSVAFGTDTLATAKRYAPQYGITIVHEVLCEPKTKDLSIQVKQMKASGAEAILSAEYEAETAVLARAISETVLNIPLSGLPGVRNAPDRPVENWP